MKQETQFRQVPGLRDIVRVAAGLRHAAAVTREAHTFYFHSIIFLFMHIYLYAKVEHFFMRKYRIFLCFMCCCVYKKVF